MKPLPISAETAQKLAKQLNVPLEHLMHMPQHILLQKLAELAQNKPAEDGPAGSGDTARPAAEPE
ncbi:YycC-like protein [Paenibacillus sp. UNCCL117]|uniref:YycC family protein n=1 Tax=unclassified Paenibacillus TaxID=185978 RepID=UPI000886883F|nr:MULTISPECIES: YycC family protein [unclassified Paenibacillus]SDE01736.1 YycC-like protein [Paenibacillus sp. cl123]SFW57063.1 YycC-like protein [Paenibacillus sp. UNCCL117]